MADGTEKEKVPAAVGIVMLVAVEFLVTLLNVTDHGVPDGRPDSVKVVKVQLLELE